MAVYEGAIWSLDDLVTGYAPQFEGTAYGETSIRQLLAMSSGIDFFHNGGSPNRQDMYWDVVNNGIDLDDWAARRERRTIGCADFNYIATDTHGASAVLRGAYDMPLAEIRS